jgi:dTDP-glucose 4,6-dehydratase
LLLDGKSGQSYNISGNNEVDNTTIVKRILDVMGKSEDLIEYVEDRPGHDFRYSMSSNKISKEYGWKPKMGFGEGIEMTVEWYLNHEEIWKDLSPKILDSTPWKNQI